MRAVLQRVTEARVEIDHAIAGAIQKGLLVLLAVSRSDTKAEADWLVEKIIHLRIFEDAQGKMNLSAVDTRGGLLIVSQFTLYGDTRKGRRPGFDEAARPEEARALYEYFVEQARATGLPVATGVFQADMAVYLCNDGPVTLICDSPASKSASAAEANI